MRLSVFWLARDECDVVMPYYYLLNIIIKLNHLFLTSFLPKSPQKNDTTTQQVDEEQYSLWLRWMKNVPSPLFLDMSSHVHELIYENHKTSNDPWISEEHLEFVDMSIEQYTSRIGCHIILLPSGFETSPLSLVESTGAHIYGKLLYGGVNRFRLLNLALSKKSKEFHHRTY